MTKMTLIGIRTLSNISLVCDALRQNLTRPPVNGVAGKPTVTTAIPCSSIRRLKAL
jgi:hypothetical protein